jgi:hypothetical protein
VLPVGAGKTDLLIFATTLAFGGDPLRDTRFVGTRRGRL